MALQSLCEFAQLCADGRPAVQPEDIRDLPLRQAAVVAEHPGGNGPIQRIPAPPPQCRAFHPEPRAHRSQNPFGRQLFAYSPKRDVLRPALAVEQRFVQRPDPRTEIRRADAQPRGPRLLEERRIDIRDPDRSSLVAPGRHMVHGPFILTLISLQIFFFSFQYPRSTITKSRAS